MTDIDQLVANSEKSLSSFNALKNATVVANPGSQPWNPWLISFLTVLILTFAGFVIHNMRSMLKDGHNPGDILRLATMPMVITAAIFLVLLGYSTDQMTPVIGLLGTMIGYVLGSTTSKGTPPGKQPSPVTPPNPA